MSRRKALEFTEFAYPHSLAGQISQKYNDWQNFRAKWLNLTKEVRDYIFATDTHTTSVNRLSWKNSTHIPKICQIRDNLHANYLAALFPNDRSVSFEADDPTFNDKKVAVEAYMRNKLRLSDFRTEASKCVYDWIDYGNCFAKVDFITEIVPDPITGEETIVYAGPKMSRISPLDIVFDPTASDFMRAPKIIRTLTTLGELKRLIDDYPEMGYLNEVFDSVLDLRTKFRTAGGGGLLDVKKNAAYLADGFSSFQNYFDSDYVELLEFYGDIYDRDSGEHMRNMHIVVVDRAYIIKQATDPSWRGVPPIFHSGWRVRNDNLYAMGPLDNLVGMQYRIDHLENAKADGYDMIMHPVFKVRGYVENFQYRPNAKIFVGDEGDVEFMNPDSSILSADTQVQQYMQLMEEMAGAPRQAMGLRTPGEKTKFEVQVLENGANRVFLNKTSHFEVTFIEPIMNSMLESARRNFGAAEEIQTQDTDFNFTEFITVSKEDLLASGNIRAIGARRFANKANMLQDITQFSNTALAQDPGVMQHFSKYKLAKLLGYLLDLEEHDIVQKDVGIMEQSETAQLVGSAQQVLGEERGVDDTTVPPNPEGNPA